MSKIRSFHDSVIRPNIFLFASMLFALVASRVVLVALGIMGFALALVLPGGLFVLAIMLRVMKGNKAREEAYARAFVVYERERRGR